MANSSECEVDTIIISNTVQEKKIKTEFNAQQETINNNNNKKKELNKNNHSDTRCNFESCNKRFGIIPYECKCGLKFCAKHRHDFDHNCTYDRKLDDTNKLKKILIDSKPKRIDKI